MREPSTHTSIDALLARPSEKMSGGEVFEVKRHLMNAVALLAEVDLYETARALAKTDPRAAQELLLDQGIDPAFEPVFPVLRQTLAADIARRMAAVDAGADVRDLAAEVLAETAAGGPADRAREAAFRSNPGRFLPGASRSSIRLIHAPGFGMVRFGGVDMPWTYAAQGMVRADYSELYRVVEDGGYSGGILVGPAAAAAEVALPDEYRFVVVELGLVGGAA